MDKNGFSDFIADIFSPLGQITVKKMFGGYGVYKDGRIFAILSDDRLAIKLSEKLGEKIIKEGAERFVYDKKSSSVSLPYYFVPDEWLDDSERITGWVLANEEEQDKG